MIRGKFNIIIGGMAGSESKGKLGAYLARKYKPEVICMSSCPNSGHSVYMGNDKFVTYHLPVSYAGHRDSLIVLGPTSVIRLSIILKEIEMFGLTPANLVIDPRAIMIRDFYLQEEKREGLLKIGSTNQGVGVARKEKLMRSEDLTFVGQVEELAPFVCSRPTSLLVNEALDQKDMVLCEMTQGFDLDLEHGIDQHFATSKMVNPSMGMAEAGVAPSRIGDVYGVLRPYPIRVNNREGSSGPYADAKEITWGEVAKRCGYPDGELLEITTTTKLPRRVFEFSHERFHHFSTVCRPDYLCLQFANYLNWDAFHCRKFEDLPPEVLQFVKMLHTKGPASVRYIGTGPDMDDMIEVF